MPTVQIASIYGYGGFTSYAAVPYYGWVIGHPLLVDERTPTGRNPHGYSVGIDPDTKVITVSWDENNSDFTSLIAGSQVWLPGDVEFSVQVGVLPGIEVTASATRNESFGVTVDIYAGSSGSAGLIRNGWYYDNPIVEYNYLGNMADVEVDFLIDWGDGTIETISPAVETWTPSIPLKTRPNQPVSEGNGTFTVNVVYVATLTAFHQFAGPNSSAGIKVTAVPGQPYQTRVTKPNIKPKAVLTATVTDDERVVHLDASQSYDIDGPITNYYFSMGSNPYTLVLASGVQDYLDWDAPNYAEYTVKLAVTDNRNQWDTTEVTFFVNRPGAAALDAHGRIWAASPDSNKMRNYWHPQNMSKYEEAPTVAGNGNAAPTALWYDAAGRLWGFFQDSFASYNFVSYNYGEFSTYDDGENEIQQFVFSGGAPVLAGDIRGAAGCALAEGGMAVAGVDFDSREIKFRLSFDGNGVSWDDEVVVGTLGSVSSVRLALFQFNGSGSSLLTILHINSGRRWTSLNYGSSWTEVPSS